MIKYAFWKFSKKWVVVIHLVSGEIRSYTTCKRIGMDDTHFYFSGPGFHIALQRKSVLGYVWTKADKDQIKSIPTADL